MTMLMAPTAPNIKQYLSSIVMHALINFNLFYTKPITQVHTNAWASGKKKQIMNQKYAEKNNMYIYTDCKTKYKTVWDHSLYIYVP